MASNRVSGWASGYNDCTGRWTGTHGHHETCQQRVTGSYAGFGSFPSECLRRGDDMLAGALPHHFRKSKKNGTTMKPTAIDDTRCPRCSAILGVGQDHCFQCGASRSSNASVVSPKRATSLLNTADRPWVICVLLFGVMGSLGIPILWMSRSISVQGKIVLTLAVMVYTVLLVWVTWLAISFAWSQIRVLVLF